MLAKAIGAAATLFTVFSTKVNVWVSGEALSFNARSSALNKNYLAVLGFVHLQNYIVTSLVFIPKK